MQERERERRRELHMAPTLLPTFTTTTTTNDRGRERGSEQDTTGTARRRWSQCQSVNQSINQHNHHIGVKTPALLSRIPSHPASQTTLSDAPWLSPSKKPQTLVPHTYTYTPYHIPFSIKTVCCNEKSQ